MNGSIERVDSKNSKKLWSLKRLYDKTYRLSEDSSRKGGRKFANKISAYVESIGQDFEEWLVSPTVLVNEMVMADFTLNETKSFGEVYEQMEKNPDALPGAKIVWDAYKKKGKHFMTEHEKEYSFMHRYWVFKKNTSSPHSHTKFPPRFRINIPKKKDVVPPPSS